MSSDNHVLQKHKLKLVTLGLAAAAVGISVWYFSASKPDPILAMITEELGPNADAILEEILSEYCMELFDQQLYELAQTAAQVNENLSSRNLRDMISSKDLAAMLLTDERRASLDKIFLDIIKSRNLKLSIDQFQKVCESRMLDNKTLRKFKDGIEKMLSDALSGVIPSVPGLPLPLDITDQRALDLLDDVLRSKRLALDSIFKNKSLMEGSVIDASIGFVPTSEASEIILKTASDAEIGSLKKARLAEDESMEMGLRSVPEDRVVIAFKSLLGLYCRERPQFIERRQEMMKRHTEQIMNLISTSLAEDTDIPHAARSHPTVRRFGGFRNIQAVTTIPRPDTDLVTYDSSKNDLMELFKWQYSVVIICTNDPDVNGSSTEQSLVEKTSNLMISDLVRILKVDKLKYTNTFFITMRLDEVQKCHEIKDLIERLNRLCNAVGNTDDATCNSLPVVLFVENLIDGCTFASRDIEEVLRRAESCSAVDCSGAEDLNNQFRNTETQNVTDVKTTQIGVAEVDANSEAKCDILKLDEPPREDEESLDQFCDPDDDADHEVKENEFMEVLDGAKSIVDQSLSVEIS
eukprot:GHVH01005058.1.p2 GENE.GHVH01005058.1~~GHVH01005058.1.p2  ORF type:complete len:579 (+),score=102.32 GHVH01005058.1:3012-4748(+)